MSKKKIASVASILVAAVCASSMAADMPDQWTKDISQTPQSGHPDTKWFQDAKFGMFMHWGLYSEAGNVWKGKDYYGSGEWLMHQAKIPAKQYAELAATFNPVHFNADDWATFVHDSGAKYLVITAKHHEGFAMFKSNVSDFNIVDATPYKKDPMALLSEACRKHGVQFGFYYSQNLDWHEQNGGGNTWDFDPKSKDIKKYYAEKSIPQTKELLSNYGPLGIMWFDMPGGLTHEETLAFMADVRKLQPNCLISSRVGQGLGDFEDLGDSELSPLPIAGPWEALFTHTDSWGFQKYDQNYKTPKEVIKLLVSTSARGGNFLLNVGPDGEGNLPEKSREYLLDVGKWLKENGEAVYGTTHSPIRDQPWGVCTAKPGKLFLHVLEVPHNNVIVVPNFTGDVKSAGMLHALASLQWKMENGTLEVTLPGNLPASLDHVIEVNYTGELQDGWKSTPAVISQEFNSVAVDASYADLAGNTKIKTQTYSQYFGNWKHDTVIEGQQSPEDTATFNLAVIEPGDYRLILEYACGADGKSQEGAIDVNGRTYTFQTLFTGPYDSHQPLMFVRHTIGIIPLSKSSDLPLVIHPLANSPSFFWLRRVVLEPVSSAP